MNLFALQRYLPARVKFALKPYYRTVFPNKLHVYLNPTFRCNYRCSYCTVVTKFAFTDVADRKDERSAAEWETAFNRLPPAAVYLAGGEPFVYAELGELIERLSGRHQIVGIVTNLSQPVSVYRKVRRRLHLNASLHRDHVEVSEFLKKAKELSAFFHIHVNVVATPENLLEMERIAGELRSAGISLHVDPLVDIGFQYTSEQLTLLQPFLAEDRNPKSQLDFNDYAPKRCSAGRNYINVAPNGNVYTCNGGMNFIHSTLYTQIVGQRNVSKFQMQNLFSEEFALNTEDIECAMPCNLACDRDTAIIRPVAKSAV